MGLSKSDRALRPLSPCPSPIGTGEPTDTLRERERKLFAFPVPLVSPAIFWLSFSQHIAVVHNPYL
ncbi:MAG: hypothetical protein KME30_32495 [Iphinoe sp. HA4291-MV1]|nr:hypothetical protein [Iphinoe sp. HA4291-MV1]